MSTPVPDISTLKGVLHMLVDVASGAVADLPASDVAAMHATIDASSAV